MHLTVFKSLVRKATGIFVKMVLKATVKKQSSKQSFPKVSSEVAICRCSSK